MDTIKIIKISTWITLFLVLSFAISCTKITSNENFELRGSVKSCDEQLHQVEFLEDGNWILGDKECYGHTIINFDETGKYQEILGFLNDSMLIGRLIPNRENGVITGSASYGANGMLIEKTLYKYKSNSVIDFNIFNANDVKTGIGRIIRNKGLTTKRIYKTIVNDKEDQTYITVFEYDKDKNQILQQEFNEAGDTISSIRNEYIEYDAENNWTKKLIFENSNIPTHIIVRKIEYFTEEEINRSNQK